MTTSCSPNEPSRTLLDGSPVRSSISRLPTVRPARRGYRIPAQISQGTLANMVGASRENVNRAILRLIRLGDVRRSGSTIVIPKVEELRRRYGWMVP